MNDEIIYTESKFGKKLKTHGLNRVKYNELFEMAVYLRDFRNKLSEFVWESPLVYMNMSSHDFLKYVRSSFDIKLSSIFDYDQIHQVYTDYKNRFDAIISIMKFEYKIFKKVEYYKNSTKLHKKGDFKKISFVTGSDRLTITLTYLARYGNNNTVEYIKQKLSDDNLNESKRDYYNSILTVIEKFGFERLMCLASQRRNKVINNYLKRDPIKYVSFTFGARSRRMDFIHYNDNFNSEIKAFVIISWDNEDKVLYLPVKYSKKFHGDMSLYNKKHHEFQYEICFDEKNREVSVCISIDGEREFLDAHDYKDYIGIDVNFKHNMFCLSNEILFDNIMTRTIDYNRDLIEEYKKLEKKIEKNKKEHPGYKEGKRIRLAKETLKNKMIMNERETITFMILAIKRAGYNHIVMENLTGISGKCFAENDEINYNNLIKFVGLSSLKDEVRHICHKYHVALSLVHPSYTSQMCPICGHIHKNNRKTQEMFVCENCGYTANADENSSENIRNRVSKDVLCTKLLKQLDNGEYEPKKINR